MEGLSQWVKKVSHVAKIQKKESSLEDEKNCDELGQDGRLKIVIANIGIFQKRATLYSKGVFAQIHFAISFPPKL